MSLEAMAWLRKEVRWRRFFAFGTRVCIKLVVKLRFALQDLRNAGGSAVVARNEDHIECWMREWRGAKCTLNMNSIMVWVPMDCSAALDIVILTQG